MKKKTRTGSKIVVSLFLSAVCFAIPLEAKKEKSKDVAVPTALIAGTVYRPPGFAMAGADILLEPETAESNGIKLRKQQAASDARGEFALRVPAVPAKWRVSVKMNGYRSEQKSASIEGEQRVDLSFMLEPATAPKEAK